MADDKISVSVRGELIQQLCERIPPGMTLALYLDTVLESWIADHPIGEGV